MKVRFTYEPTCFTDIRTVNLAGSFNGWDHHKDPLKPNSHRLWEIEKDLEEGYYPYKYLINGADWIHDLKAPRFEQNEIGSLNSIAIVKETPARHGTFSPLKPTLNDRITFYCDRPAEIIWCMNGWVPYARGYLKNTIQDLQVNVFKMEKSHSAPGYEYTIGPFSKGRIPEVIIYSFLYENGVWDDNFGRCYFLPLDLQLGGTIRTESFHSRALGGHPKFRLYLPKGYSRNRSWPVIYLLHGYGGSHHADWTQADTFKTLADRYGVILVWPNGNVWVYGEPVPSWYINSPAVPTAQMEDYITRELVPYMEKNYGAGKDRTHRAAAGISMGGFGAMYLATKYHDVFCAGGSMSAIYNLSKYKKLDALRKLVGEGNWRGKNFNSIKLCRQAKRSAFYFIFGDEERGALKDNFSLKLKMVEENIPHEFHIYPGNHTNNFWRMHLQEMMQFLVDHMG
ncbi:MAG: hypothetical protein HYU64_00570 [Armatimonadetes bacterium]|nr:hypothetical protein [Armatimonadota bacterium]